MQGIWSSWQVWAGLAAVFAALTAIFAKIGVSDIAADLATLIRTVVVLLLLLAIVSITGQWQPLQEISRRSWVFLLLSGLATGASWLCYFRALQLGDVARVAPVDKLSVVMVALFGAVLLGETLSLLNWLGILLVAVGSLLVAWKTV